MNLDARELSIMKHDTGPTEPVVTHFDLVHGDRSLWVDLGEGLKDGLFRGEAAGKVQQSRSAASAGVAFLILSEDPPNEGAAAPTNRLSEPGELDDVDAATNRRRRGNERSLGSLRRFGGHFLVSAGGYQSSP